MLALGLIIPFVGTTLGAATVFLMKNSINETLEKLLLGFASGVMIAASLWSLLIPSIEMLGEYRFRFIPATVGFLFGIAFLLALDRAIGRIYSENNMKKTGMMVLAVTLHNIPEGMAVGVALASAIKCNSGISIAAAMALSIGIAVQNFPEGAIISMPLKSGGISKGKAFLLGMLSGAVEPLFGVITVLLTNAIITALPYFLAFAAGAMIYVVVEELIPESQRGRHSTFATLGLAIGFVIMMILDVYFS